MIFLVFPRDVENVFDGTILSEPEMTCRYRCRFWVVFMTFYTYKSLAGRTPMGTEWGWLQSEGRCFAINHRHSNMTVVIRTDGLRSPTCKTHIGIQSARVYGYWSGYADTYERGPQM
jgi:hypothetical protein